MTPTVVMTAITIFALLYSWVDMARVRRHELTLVPIDAEREKLIAAAMEELDDIDRLVGLLPPKPRLELPAYKPRSVSQRERKYRQMEIARGWQWEYNYSNSWRLTMDSGPR